MTRALRSTLTLVFLVAVLLGAAFWGWGALTAPLPTSEDQPPCEETLVPAGTRVYPDQVTVSVFNASTRSGLAGRTMGLFTEAGFAEGSQGNAPRGTTVTRAQIWADDAKNPAVRLVRSHLGQGTPVVAGEDLGPGVVVVVGQDFEELVKGKKSAKSPSDKMVCIPPEANDSSE